MPATMPPMAEKKKTAKKVGRPLDGDAPKVVLSARVDARLIEQLQKLVVIDRRPKPILVEMALEQFLAEKGLWPPQD